MAILPSSGFALVALLAGVFLVVQDVRTPAVADETPERRPAVVRLTPDVICEVLAKTAASNGLPVDFFTRLIWQESRFKPDAVSPAGAQGIAQFMPQTARMRGLEDPFDPLEAIAKSAELLRDLSQDLGNFGLAAAAYNAGPARVREWMSARRALPRETNAYVLIVTGHPIEDWSSPPIPDMSVLEHVPCDQFAVAFPSRIEVLFSKLAPKPWGVEVVGGPTKVAALTKYQQWQTKYPAILAKRPPHFLIRGTIGEMGAVRVRVDADTRDEAAKLCAGLRAAGAHCDVMRN